MAKKIQAKKTVPLKTVLIVTGVLLVLVFFGGQTVLRDLLFYPPAPSANYPTPANETEARIQDLDYLELYVRGYDRSFSFRARGRGLQLIKEAQARAERPRSGPCMHPDWSLPVFATSPPSRITDAGHLIAGACDRGSPYEL